MKIESENVSVEWVSMYFPLIGEQSLFMSVTCQCSHPLHQRQSRAPWGLRLKALEAPRLPTTPLNLKTGSCAARM